MRQRFAWRWTSLDRDPARRPTRFHEVLDSDDAIWFARISLAEASLHRPIVMVHGVVVSGVYFQPVAKCLHDDFDLYIPDLPGTGQSHSHTGHWTIPQLAAGLAGWMDQHGLTDAILVSNSIGCQVLTMLASRRPDLVRALILVSPTMDPNVSSAIRLMARGALDMPRERLDLWKIWTHDLLRTGPVEGLHTLRDAIDDPLVARLPLIQAPAIVVGGEHDPIVPRKWVDEMAACLPRGRAVIIPNAPHAVNFTSPRRLSWIIRAAAGAWPVTRRD